MSTQSTDKTQTVPKTWDGAFKVYKNSKAVILTNWKPYLLIIMVSMLVSAIQDRATSGDDMSMDISGPNMLIALVCFLVTVLLSVSLTRIILAGLGSKKIDALDTIKKSFSYMLSYLLMSIVIGVMLTVSLLLLIVPFFFVLPRLVLAQYFLIDKNMGPIESIKASWNATKGHVSKSWGVIGANIAMALLVITIVGIPFAVYFLFMYSAAFGVLYSYITRKKSDN